MDRSVTEPTEKEQNVFQALQLLGTLADLTRESLSQQIKKSQETVPENTRFTTSTPAYAPALSDPGLIEALLRLQPGPAQAPQTEESQAQEAKDENSGFCAMDLPLVDATPKPSPFFRKVTGPFTPILR